MDRVFFCYSCRERE